MAYTYVPRYPVQPEGLVFEATETCVHRELPMSQSLQPLVCGRWPANRVHIPVGECEGCRAPQDHHEYVPGEAFCMEDLP